MIDPLDFFQAREDCHQFSIANGTNPLLRHHEGYWSVETKGTRVASLILVFIAGEPQKLDRQKYISVEASL